MENGLHASDNNNEQSRTDNNQSEEPSENTREEQAVGAALPSVELVEVMPGTAVVFGDVPEDMDLLDFGLVPQEDRDRVSNALGTLGNVGSVYGNLANAAQSVQGLYRVNDATMALLNSGARLASKDGAKLGTLFQNGKMVAQARFVPVSMTAASTLASIGPAIAMIALQMQLDGINKLVQANIALTQQTLQTINQEQWAELAGLSKSINRAIDQSKRVGQVTASIWENVAGNEPILDKQLDLYSQKVKSHIQKVHQLDGEARQEYLKNNAEAILFDSKALLYALKVQAGYQMLRAAYSRVLGKNDDSEARLAEVIEQDMRDATKIGVDNSRRLVGALMRELRIVAELPGRAKLPLTKSWRFKKTSKMTCRQLLDSLEPLANTLHPVAENIEIPALVSAPENTDVHSYLHILRWFMHDGEKLKGLSFVYQPGQRDLTGVVPQLLMKRVDAVWDSAESGALASVIDKTTLAKCVMFTDRRIIVVSPHDFLNRGVIETSVPIKDIRYVRTPDVSDCQVRKTIDIVTERHNLRWMFPKQVSDDAIARLTNLVTTASTEHSEQPDVEKGKQSDPAAIESAMKIQD